MWVEPHSPGRPNGHFLSPYNVFFTCPDGILRPRQRRRCANQACSTDPTRDYECPATRNLRRDLLCAYISRSAHAINSPSETGLHGSNRAMPILNDNA
jgi:hypothetical protein